MTRTALALNPKEWQAYRPVTKMDGVQIAERWESAWNVACRAGDVLRQKFGAARVSVFGSLAHRAWFTPWSDIDLAAWGIPPSRFYQAVAAVTGLSSEFEINLIAWEDCQPALCQAIEREGIEL